MNKRWITVISIVSFFCFFAVTLSYAEQKETWGMKFKRFWQGIFKYPAKATEETVDTVTETGKKGTKVITTEVERMGEVTSGKIGKTKELIVEPLTGAAETGKTAVERTVNIPVKAAKETVK